MKYIIWGAGQRGKRALDILGDEQVICFVDSSPAKIGTIYEGKSVNQLRILPQICLIVF